MLKINPIHMNADAAQAIRCSVSGNLGRLADQSLEASSLVAPGGGNSNSEAMKMVDELFEDLKLLTDIFKSPILHHIAMK